ncbi:MAG: energy transducer TonB, partial [Treponema sp.]|nr:energy transducer TonB [Treponema sp.]
MSVLWYAMLNERLLRLILVIVVTAIHIVLIFFAAFNVNTISQEELENARVMKLTDLEEAPPPPPEEEELPQVEAIAETLIETDTPPLQTIVAHGIITPPTTVVVPTWDDYIPMHRVSEAPRFDEREIYAALVYPPIAQRSGIEGRVILELFVDKNGIVQRISVLLEDPKDRGFGEAAIRAFSGLRGVPALANGEPVSARYRYPVRFTIK